MDYSTIIWDLATAFAPSLIVFECLTLVFDLLKHVPGHRIAAKLPLGKARFQPCLFDFFAQFHIYPPGK